MTYTHRQAYKWQHSKTHKKVDTTAKLIGRAHGGYHALLSQNSKLSHCGYRHELSSIDLRCLGYPGPLYPLTLTLSPQVGPQT